VLVANASAAVVCPSCQTLAIMPTSSDAPSTLLQRYAYWEKAAPLTLLVLCAVVAASAYLHMPSPLFIAANSLAGVLAFLAWRTSLNGNTWRTVALVLSALVSALVAPASAIELPLPLLFSQGIGIVGAAFSLGFIIARYTMPVVNASTLK